MVAYRFGGSRGRVTADHYWRDVGTIDAYYEANMDLLHPVPAMDLYQGDWAIRTYEGQHPPARSVPGPSCRSRKCVSLPDDDDAAVRYREPLGIALRTGNWQVGWLYAGIYRRPTNAVAIPRK